jgi:pilus assembly protein CpaB
MLDGLIKPGDYVDVHFTLDPQGASGLDERLSRLGGVSFTLLKGVKVLALNRGFRQSPVLPTGNSLTLELEPSQTNVLLVAQPRGTLSFSFNPNGEGTGGIALSNANRATLWEVLGLKKPARKPDPEDPEQPFVTEIYRGTGSGSMQWNKDGKKFDPRSVGNGPGRGNAGGAANSNFGSTDQPLGGSRGQDQDVFDPDNVFLDSGSRGNDVPNQETAPAPSADPDIPVPQPDSATKGVRSRVGSMLRARPNSASSAAGPTALRD